MFTAKYQEIALGVGQDRADVVSVSETVITPAGKFENCVHTIETSPIEKTLRTTSGMRRELELGVGLLLAANTAGSGLGP